MTIPGSNLLALAQTVIAKQSIIFYRRVSTTVNDAGYKVSGFEPGVVQFHSVQAVPDQIVRQMGLDASKKYLMIYSSDQPITGLQRGNGGDQWGFATRRWNTMDDNDWTPIDGWEGVMCVDVGEDKGDA